MTGQISSFQDATVRETTIYTRGCFYALVERLKSDILIVAGIGIGILIPQVMEYRTLYIFQPNVLKLAILGVEPNMSLPNLFDSLASSNFTI